MSLKKSLFIAGDHVIRLLPKKVVFFCQVIEDSSNNVVDSYAVDRLDILDILHIIR